MYTIEPIVPLLILILSGLVAWFGTRFVYDLISKIFTPVEPIKRTLNEKTDKRKGRLIYQDPDSDEAIFENPVTGEQYVESTIYARGGKGNPKILQFTSYEKKE